MKACQYMQNNAISTALVSTNSITQGEQVSSVFEPLFTRYKMDILFAHKTFVWSSETLQKAHVHCVIIGFCVMPNTKIKFIYTGEKK